MNDDSTQGIVLVGEVGGTMEEDAAELIKEKYLDNKGRPNKPVVGFIAGRNVPPGQIFGHSGAIWRDGLGSAEQKRQIWRNAGIVLVDAIGEVGGAIEAELLRRSKK
jgi:succinyl-CoA synthetase alpha subunit